MESIPKSIFNRIMLIPTHTNYILGL